MNRMDRCLELLELKAGATPTEIRDAYREQAKVWHPDRFEPGTKLYAKAQARLKEINDAYAFLRKRPSRTSDGGGRAAAAAETANVGKEKERPAPEATPRSRSNGERRSSRRLSGRRRWILAAALLGAAALVTLTVWSRVSGRPVRNSGSQELLLSPEQPEKAQRVLERWRAADPTHDEESRTQELELGERWEFVSRDADGFQYHMDRQTLGAASDVVAVRIRRTNPDVATDFTVERCLFQCATREYQQELEGSAGVSRPVAPGTVGEIVMSRVCGEPAAP